MAEYKNITAVPLKSEPAQTENIIVEDNGVAKRIPFTKVGGGGAGFDVVITAKGSFDEKDEEDDEVRINLTDITVTSSLTFDELFAKWLTFTYLIGIDCSDIGMVSSSGEKLCKRATTCPTEDQCMVFNSLDSETASLISANEGDKCIVICPSFSYCSAYDSDDANYDDSYEVCINEDIFALKKGASGQIVCVAVAAG